MGAQSGNHDTRKGISFAGCRLITLVPEVEERLGVRIGVALGQNGLETLDEMGQSVKRREASSSDSCDTVNER